MTDTPPRPAARAPRGFADKRAQGLAAERRILSAVAQVYERYGFEPFDTSAFEYADALGKFLPDADRPNEGVFALADDDEQWMALRYDLTAPLARFAAQNWEGLPKPFRRYAYGPVWRNEKPGPGRYREFVQCDADTVGSARPEADAEVVAAAAEGLEAAGLPRGAYVLRINNRKLLDGILGEVPDPRMRLTALRAIDKYDRFGWEGVRQLLGDGRLDPSGDFTAGALLPPKLIADLEFLMATGSSPSLTRADRIKALALLNNSPTFEAALRELDDISSALSAMNVGEETAVIDPTVVRGLEYYTGPVFEAELLLQTKDERGEAVRFGSVGGGGRYDDLVARFTGEAIPATGFSFGVSRLAAALRAAGRDAGAGARGPVVVIALDEARMADYFGAAAELRAAGIPAEVYLGASGMRAQMKYADRRLSPAAVILGEDELAAGTVTVKDLDLGRELSGQVSDNREWREARPGQQTVPRADLVAAVRRILEAAP